MEVHLCTGDNMIRIQLYDQTQELFTLIKIHYDRKNVNWKESTYMYNISNVSIFHVGSVIETLFHVNNSLFGQKVEFKPTHSKK